MLLTACSFAEARDEFEAIDHVSAHEHFPKSREWITLRQLGPYSRFLAFYDVKLEGWVHGSLHHYGKMCDWPCLVNAQAPRKLPWAGKAGHLSYGHLD